MQLSHINTVKKYDEYRAEARKIARAQLPDHLRHASELKSIDADALASAKTWDRDPNRLIDWDWSFASRYTYRYPKAFDLAVWIGNTLCSLTLGRPSFNGTFMRLDFIEKAPSNCPFSSDMVATSILAYQTYASLVGATSFRIVDPINDKVVQSYLQFDGFKFKTGQKGNPDYLEKIL